ncbi:unnamed protein product [Heterobilharzia americana]|nr:unnamed protein product [Heterobilharzia americana]
MTFDLSVPLEGQQLLFTQSFFDLRDECYALMDVKCERIAVQLSEGTPLCAYSKLFSQFCLCYEELKKWLLRLRSLAVQRDLVCLSRSETYMSQNYFGYIKNRDVDLSRLRSLGNKLLEMTIMRSNPLVIQSVESAKVSHDFDVYNRLQEIENLWNDITTVVLPMSFLHDPARTLKDVELDLKEIEAKLRSIKRQTFHLRKGLINSVGGPCGMNSAMAALKAEHISLKGAVSTLSAASNLILQLQASVVQNRLCSNSNENFDPFLFKLTEYTDELTYTSCSLWIMHLELREYWKFVSRRRSSFESGLSGSSLGVRNSRSLVGLDHSTTSDHLLIKPSSMSCSLSAGLFPSLPFADIYHSVSYPRLGSKLWRTLTEHQNINSEIHMRDSASSIYSLCCPESGFASDNDYFLKSQLSNRLDSPCTGQVAFESLCRKLQSTNSPCSLYDKRRSQSSECLWICNIDSNDSEAINDSSIELYHENSDRTPIKSVISRLEHNENNDDSRKTEHYKTPLSYFDNLDRRSLKTRASSYHDLTPFCSRLHSNDCDIQAECPSLEQPTSKSETNIFKMPVATLLHSPVNSRISRPPNSSCSSTYHAESPNSKKFRRNSLSSLIFCIDNHSNSEINNLTKTVNGDLEDTTFSELILSSTELESNSYSLDAQKSPDITSPYVTEDNPKSSDHDGDYAVDTRIVKNSCFNLTDNDMNHGTDDNPDISVDGLEWDDLGDIRGIKPSSLDSCCTSSPFKSRESLEGLNGSEVNTKVSSGVHCSSLTLAAKAMEALIEPQIRHRNQAVNPCRKLYAEHETHPYNRNSLCFRTIDTSSSTPNSSPMCESDLFTLLASIRSDALPLIGLLSRLEESSVTGLLDSKFVKTYESQCSSKFEDERRQLDIDRSYLQHFDKRLTQWTDTVDRLRSQIFIDYPSPDEANSKTQLKSSLSVALDTFNDWLSALKARHTIAFWILDWRTSVFDHLAGESHDANLSLLAMKQRVHTAIQRAHETIKLYLESYHKFTSSAVDTDNDIKDRSNEIHSYLPFSSTQSSSQVLNTLEELRNLNENLWNIQSHLGSCYLFDDFLKFSCHSNIFTQHCDQSLYSVNSEASTINIPNCSITKLIQLSSSLRQQILSAIRDLESAMMTQPNSIILKTKEVSLTAGNQELIYSHDSFTTQEDIRSNGMYVNGHDPCIDDKCFLAEASNSCSYFPLISSPPSDIECESSSYFVAWISRKPSIKYLLIALFLFIILYFVLFEHFFGDCFRVLPTFSSHLNCYGDGPIVELSTNRLVKYLLCFQLPKPENLFW